MISELTNALVAISFWKLIILGAFGVIALIFIFLIASLFSPAAVDGSPFHKIEEKRVVHSGPMAVSPQAMGFGVFFIALGLCILASLYGFNDTSVWTILGIVMLCGGMGMIVAYVIGSKAGVVQYEDVVENDE